MEFEIACTCGQNMLVEEQYVGREVECPACGGLLPVPPKPVDEDDVPVVAPMASAVDETYGRTTKAPPPPPPPPSPRNEPLDPGYAMPEPNVGDAQTHPKAIIALVLGVIGIVGCPIIPSIGALVLASQAKHDMRLRPDLYSGMGLATVAQILGAIPLVLIGLGILLAFATPFLTPPP